MMGFMKRLYKLGDKINRLTIIGDEFRRNRSGRNRHHYKCECECGNITFVEGYNLNNGRYKSCGCLRKSQGGFAHTREHRLWNSARNRCKKSGMEFSISREDIIIPTHCPLLGIKISLDDGEMATSPSLDRKDASKGYVPENVWVISHRANQIKNDATKEEIQLMLENWDKMK